MPLRNRAIAGIVKWILIPAVSWIVVLGALFAILTQPSCRRYPATGKTVAPDRLREHVYALAIDYAPRNYRQLWNLDACAHYISDQFDKAGGVVSEQAYHVEGAGYGVEQVKENTYRNVIASFGPEDGPRIIVGAHYDACEQTPGADDNASGVSGLIELAYLLGRADLEQRVDLVAYTLEEPPFFRTPDMGSARHAKMLKQDGVEVKVMICLEMIGYFSDEKGSQESPSVILQPITPERGDFIVVSGGFNDRKLIRTMKAVMRGATDLPVHALCAPPTFAGLDLSDQHNYWALGYNAVMVTDTSFYRNRNYHQIGDTPGTLDYDRMSKVVLGVYEAVVQLANDTE